MLRHTKDLKGFKLDLTDGELGRIEDFYFDDMLWVVRYVVIDTGKWLPKRKVLISPVSLGNVDEDKKKIQVNLSKETVEKSPSISPDQPLLRKEELVLSGYYDWPAYWEEISLEINSNPDSEDALNLRSTQEVIGYTVEALDGEVGIISNFIVDDLDWTARYMVVDTKKILPGRTVLLALDWIKRIDCVEKKVIVDVTKDTIQSTPQYKPEKPINRLIETELFDHYKKEV